jgi:alpha-L-rhamnosidase
MDCPHRERYGYGEIQLACSWGCSLPHFLAAAYWRKVSRDWADVQRDDGFINTIAPQIYSGAGGTLWSSALVTLNRESFLAYGDERHLREAYPGMKKWLDFLHASVSDDGVLVPYDRVSRFLGDWATPHGSEYGNTPEAALFNNCVYAYNLIIVIEAAKALGHADDAQIYQQRLDALRENAHRHFFDAENKRYIDGRQLAMAFPLYVGITPESEREAVMAGFIEEITRRKPYLDTGSSGLPILLKFLVEARRPRRSAGALLWPAPNTPDTATFSPRAPPPGLNIGSAKRKAARSTPAIPASPASSPAPSAASAPIPRIPACGNS